MASAAPLSFTGAELTTLTGASFPTGGQTIIGDSLRFDPTILRPILYRLDLSDFNVDPSEIAISVQVTRLLSDGGALDNDFHIGIYDGQTYFHSIFLDIIPPNLARRHFASSLIDGGTSFESSMLPGQSAEIVAPAGEFAQYDVTIRATPTFTEILSDANQSGSFSNQTSTLLDNNAGLSLVFAGQNIAENYLVNSLTFTRGVSLPTAVPEPSALAGLGLGFLGFAGLMRRRRK